MKKIIVLLSVVCFSITIYSFKGTNSPQDEIPWCVKMWIIDANTGKGSCKMVEVKAERDPNKGYEQAKKKAKEIYPGCSALGAWEKNSQGCNCN
jgi:hypothetical protein